MKMVSIPSSRSLLCHRGKLHHVVNSSSLFVVYLSAFIRWRNCHEEKMYKENKLIHKNKELARVRLTDVVNIHLFSPYKCRDPYDKCSWVENRWFGNKKTKNEWRIIRFIIKYINKYASKTCDRRNTFLSLAIMICINKKVGKKCL